MNYTPVVTGRGHCALQAKYPMDLFRYLGARRTQMKLPTSADCSKTARDSRDSDVHGTDEAMHSRGAHTWRVSLKLSHLPAPRSAACTCAACRSRAVFGLLRGDLGGISSTSHSVGLWSQDVRKTYAAVLLQQDGGDSDVRGGDETVHSRGAYIACVSQAVTRAIAMLCCIDMCRVQVMCSPWTCEVTSVQWHLFPICSS